MHHPSCKTLLLTSVHLFLPACALRLPAWPSREVALWEQQCVCSLCFSASGFSRVSFLPHINELATVEEKFGPGVFQTLIRSGFLSAACFRGERGGRNGKARPASARGWAAMCCWFWSRCGYTHSSLIGIFRGKKKYLFIVSVPANRVVPLCTEKLQMPWIFMGIPPVFQESKDLWDSPALSYSITLRGR